MCNGDTRNNTNKTLDSRVQLPSPSSGGTPVLPTAASPIASLRIWHKKTGNKSCTHAAFGPTKQTTSTSNKQDNKQERDRGRKTERERGRHTHTDTTLIPHNDTVASFHMKAGCTALQQKLQDQLPAVDFRPNFAKIGPQHRHQHLGTRLQHAPVAPAH